jgi:DNA mismatch endonuclease (patch repair protein)
MRSNRAVDTTPEVALRSALHRRGLRFRKGLRIRVDGEAYRADVAFPRVRVAVFCDGCFWHRCPIHGTDPKRNASYWLPKLEANVRRDRLADQALRLAGWEVMRFWEHELHDDLEAVTDAIVVAVTTRAAAHPPGTRRTGHAST